MLHIHILEFSWDCLLNILWTTLKWFMSTLFCITSKNFIILFEFFEIWKNLLVLIIIIFINFNNLNSRDGYKELLKFYPIEHPIVV
jgi:hypothetical protein